jgi:hypothetical protein
MSRIPPRPSWPAAWPPAPRRSPQQASRDPALGDDLGPERTYLQLRDCVTELVLGSGQTTGS